MKTGLFLTLAAAALLSTPASAELVRADPGGITVIHRVSLNAPPAKAYAAFGNIGRYWADAHTYGGKASALSLKLVPGGCFCEAMAGGGIEHGRVIVAWPNRQVIMQSLLGPAASIGTAGVLEANFDKAADGSGGTDLFVRYRLTGLATDEAVSIGRAIDKVIGEQVASFAAYSGGERTKVTKE